MLSKLKYSVYDLVLSYVIRKKRRLVTHEELLPFIEDKSLPALTADEKARVDALWRPVCRKIDYRYFRLFKAVVGFSETYVPDDIFMPYLIRSLNTTPYFSVLQDKLLYDVFYTAMPQPATYLKSIRGEYYIDGRHVDRARALSALAGRDFIIKNTSGTCGGYGIEIYRGASGTPSRTIQEVLDSHRRWNYLCQELVGQSPLTARFNETSLNTFRISTVNVGGRVTAETIMFRHGQAGSIVDNAAAGGVFAGVTPDGRFSAVGYDKKYNVYETLPDGARYGDVVIPQVADAVELACRCHQRYMPMCGFAGWDICLDKDNRPVMIEVNLGYPSIMMEQMCNGKNIFGDRLQEVLDFCLANRYEVNVRSVTTPSM